MVFGWVLGENERDQQVQARRFDRIARRYDTVNEVASLGRSRAWTRAFADAVIESVVDAERRSVPDGAGSRADVHGAAADASVTADGANAARHSIALPLAGLNILDMACGTGESSRALAALGASVTGCDISEGMLRQARRRTRGSWAGSVTYVLSDAMTLKGFEDGFFDAVTCCYGLRNMPSPTTALEQAHRVARPGAPVVTMDFDMPQDAVLPTLYRLYNAIVLPAVGGAFTGHPSDYRYLADSIEQWPGRSGVAHMMRIAGLDHISMRPLDHGLVSITRGFAPIPTPPEPEDQA